MGQWDRLSNYIIYKSFLPLGLSRRSQHRIWLAGQKNATNGGFCANFVYFNYS